MIFEVRSSGFLHGERDAALGYYRHIDDRFLVHYALTNRDGLHENDRVPRGNPDLSFRLVLEDT